MSNDLQLAERQVKALTLRRQGKSYWMIANELGISTSTAYKDVQQGLAQIRTEAGEKAVEIIELETQRLDEMWDAVYSAALGGNKDALELCLKIMNRRAKMLGLDKPTKVDGRLLTVDLSDEELEDEARKLGIPMENRNERSA